MKLYNTIDWQLLAAQKLHLLSAIDNATNYDTQNEAEGLNGILALIDGIQDEAKELGYPVVFLDELPNADDAEPEETEDAEPQDPEEEDIVTSDGLNFYQDGYLVLTIGPDDDRDARLQEYMNAREFWPNCWNISDHGNAHLIHFDNREN